MAGLYHGHILEFPQIRIDCFTQPPSSSPYLIPTPSDHSQLGPAPAAQLYLLSHVHTDHLIGLTGNFQGQIICSADTKAMLLQYETEKERVAFDRGEKERVVKNFGGLRGRRMKAEVDKDGGRRMRSMPGLPVKGDRSIWVDHITIIPYNTPTTYTLSSTLNLAITLLPASHCPGSTMFLLESPEHAVLHTGDVRADEPFIMGLRRCEALGMYLGDWAGVAVARPEKAELELVKAEGGGAAKRNYDDLDIRNTPDGFGCGRRILDRIYLDTSAQLGTGDTPTREVAIRDLLEILRLYPSDTIFFIHSWTWGYEDCLKGIAAVLGTKIHFDRFKRETYTSTSDPFIRRIFTSSPSTRLHACERSNQCDFLRNARSETPEKVVDVQFVEEKLLEHKVFMDEVRERCGSAMDGKGVWPTQLRCPLARHAPLPELQALVNLFKPLSITPNTLLPGINGLDYYLLSSGFASCLSPSLDSSGQTRVLRECREWAKNRFGLKTDDQVDSMMRETCRESFGVNVGILSDGGKNSWDKLPIGHEKPAISPMRGGVGGGIKRSRSRSNEASGMDNNKRRDMHGLAPRPIGMTGPSTRPEMRDGIDRSQRGRRVGKVVQIEAHFPGKTDTFEHTGNDWNIVDTPTSQWQVSSSYEVQRYGGEDDEEEETPPRYEETPNDDAEFEEVYTAPLPIKLQANPENIEDMQVIKGKLESIKDPPATLDRQTDVVSIATSSVASVEPRAAVAIKAESDIKPIMRPYVRSDRNGSSLRNRLRFGVGGKARASLSQGKKESIVKPEASCEV